MRTPSFLAVAAVLLVGHLPAEPQTGGDVLGLRPPSSDRTSLARQAARNPGRMAIASRCAADKA